MTPPHAMPARERELELTGPEFHRLARQALDRLVPFVDTLGAQPAFSLENPVQLARELAEPLPE
ncbi:MAG TPA: hypothetical protein VD793_03315, partial [Gemmatimonadales bacterium]|nr:hypothetical protein [Gemmatimonadales bacterium]